jgi:hypothetical protein
LLSDKLFNNVTNVTAAKQLVLVCEKIALGLQRGPFDKPKQVVLLHEPHVAKLSINKIFNYYFNV